MFGRSNPRAQTATAEWELGGERVTPMPTASERVLVRYTGSCARSPVMGPLGYGLRVPTPSSSTVGHCPSATVHDVQFHRIASKHKAACDHPAASSALRPSTFLPTLMKEYKDLTADPIYDMLTAGPVNEDNMLEWEALIQGPEGTPYEGGIFAAKLYFPSDYPLNPFKMVFDPPLLHPNIYPNGTVCISILHPPGDDPLRYESASERWSPVQGVRSVLLSVLSMLAEPNIESGADIERVTGQCSSSSAPALASLSNVAPEFERRVREQVKRLLGL
ncbi:uncharacterized protein EHS24_003269 [Apiotrichum porosum]|uniref:UBC core domain-containing protein n=1 Tax=Apiotrichum porosum TaxID=105984 RepID=A0A427XFV6_9TREE|nr:uncharacterized protein EHS24_003269 [Apiotrichum porosum]RSH77702.1 hypothetical protein EHS24_003269 [Apiotrichum porosum]